jgi:hypothetical protein
MCMADVHICQCILIAYAWLKAYVVQILRFCNKPDYLFLIPAEENIGVKSL